MEVQDHTNPDELSPEEVQHIVAKPGERYPIRLLHLQNGILIIGFVISVFPETAMVLRPYVVEAVYNPDAHNIEEYEFTPYLDQMAYFDPTDLTPIPFMNSCLVSIVRPAQHLIDNYTGIIRFKEVISVTDEKDPLDLLYKRSYVDPQTRH